MSSFPAAGRARRGIPWLIVAGVLVAALSLRGPIVAPTPVLRQIEHDYGIGSAAAGLLTTLPVLMFAVLTPVAAIIIRRTGAEIALFTSLAGVLVGTFVRAIPGFGWMLAGMVVIGASITIGNIVIPVIIRRDVPPERVATVTAAYAAATNVGSLVTALFTAPLADVVGWSWALLMWSAITLAGLALWTVHARRQRLTGGVDRLSGEPAAHRTPPRSAEEQRTAELAETITGPLPVVGSRRDERGILRRPIAWLLVGAFGTQCLIYYGLTTWLPALTADELGLGASAAGALASLYQGAGIAGAFIVPLLARYAPRYVPALTICASWLVLTIGLVFAPEMLWLWLVIGAVGHAGGFVVVFTALIGVSRSDREAAGMSALVQGGGYALGAAGGPFVGWMHDVSGGWNTPLVVCMALSVVYCVLLLAATARSAPLR
ncbi:CynX/NimT family MFS transporter [Microbacterium sp. NPDC055910]|uniref:MFS transporter n=1 Tax=Microbacterium sp. NPDC055910 TaxID=3345659 RepID=UPI0035DEF512